MSTRGERGAVISGAGQSQIGRKLNRPGLDLTLEACLGAIDHAGLTTADIDGVSSYPGAFGPAGFSGAGITDVHDALRLNLNWFQSGVESPGQLGSVINAALAVSAGLCRHVLCFRSVTESSAQGNQGREAVTMGGFGAGGRVDGAQQWTMPFNAVSAANWIAMAAQRHFHEFGTTREQLGWIPVVQRAHAALNPNGLLRDPMSIDDYLGARMISWPLGLYDCDLPCDGATAVIVSAPDTAADRPRPPVQIHAVGTAIHGRPSWDQWDDLTTMALRDASTMMWSRADLTPADVDVVCAYDGFSIITLMWLEALGFCGRGEGGPFVEGGERIRLGGRGDIVLNPHGGQLSSGRLHGYGFLHEACVQLWGEAGDRQVPDAEVAIAAAGGGPLGGAMLLTR